MASLYLLDLPEGDSRIWARPGGTCMSTKDIQRDLAGQPVPSPCGKVCWISTPPHMLSETLLLSWAVALPNLLET